jgi:hypothetical protein
VVIALEDTRKNCKQLKKRRANWMHIKAAAVLCACNKLSNSIHCCSDSTAAAYKMTVYVDTTLTYDMSQTALQHTCQYSVVLIMLYRPLLLLFLPVKDSNSISIYMCSHYTKHVPEHIKHKLCRRCIQLTVLSSAAVYFLIKQYTVA